MSFNLFFKIITIFALFKFSDSLNEDQCFLISFKGGTEGVLNSIKETSDRSVRIQSVVNALKLRRDASQTNVIHFLKERGIHFQSLYISNQIYICEVDQSTLDYLINFLEVSDIRSNEVFQIEFEYHQDKSHLWGLDMIRATDVWDEGFTGKGVKIGVIDTGVRWTHEALVENYVGTADYGWRDPYEDSQEPFDAVGHGSHVTGTILGKGVGVAPDARWMACRGCATETCSQTQLLLCAEFMLCPTDTYGQNPDCSLAPHLVSNSLGSLFPGIWFEQALNAWEAAGILSIFAMGNMGHYCEMVQYPGSSPRTIGVGGTNETDGLADFSSMGPVFESTRIKPDISAPGQNIWSVLGDTDQAYGSASGTSMAAPHVSGVVALMLEKNPSLTLAQTRQILYETTHRDLPKTGLNCAGIDESQFPNNAHGYGRLDAFEAVKAA